MRKTEQDETPPVRLARRPCPEEEIRNRPLRVFLNETEERKLNADAAERGLNRHDYVRALIAGQTTKTVVRGHAADPRLIEELNRVGVNLNQAVKYVHAGSTRETDWDALREQLEEVLHAVLFGPEVEDEERDGELDAGEAWNVR